MKTFFTIATYSESTSFVDAVFCIHDCYESENMRVQSLSKMAVSD